jgi:hypothetical protein
MPLDEAHATNAVHDTLVTVWIGEPTPPRLLAIAEQLCQVAERNDGHVFMYNVITPTTIMPSAKGRAALQEQFAVMRGRLSALAIVLEKTGIQGQLARTVLSSIISVARRPFPMRVFGAGAEAATWLVAQGARASVAALTSNAEGLALKLRMHENDARVDLPE